MLGGNLYGTGFAYKSFLERLDIDGQKIGKPRKRQCVNHPNQKQLPDDALWGSALHSHVNPPNHLIVN